MASKKFIFGNWKMAQTLVSAQSFIEAWDFKDAPNTEVAVFPSSIHLALAGGKIRELQKNILLGAQDCSTEEKGAFTGEISAAMIKEIGCRYVLVGHSERRQRGAETEVSLKKKLEQVLKAGLIPVYCLGETEDERDAGKLLDVLKKQAAILTAFSEPFPVAYEPVWAIGTGKVATEKDILQAHSNLREMLPKTPLLYGGSVNSGNAKGILSLPNVDGLLVGGASLKPDEFQKIAASV